MAPIELPACSFPLHSKGVWGLKGPPNRIHSNASDNTMVKRALETTDLVEKSLNRIVKEVSKVRHGQIKNEHQKRSHVIYNRFSPKVSGNHVNNHPVAVGIIATSATHVSTPMAISTYPHTGGSEQCFAEATRFQIKRITNR